jgi:hypothetical protein
VSATIREWSEFVLPCGAINPSERYGVTNLLESEFRTINGAVTTTEIAVADREDGRMMLKHVRDYWLLLTENHLTQRLFAAMVFGITVLPLPAG